MNNRNRYVAMVLCLAAVYYGAAELGLSLAFETPSVSAVWAPTGIALAALVLFGLRYWPGVALGALLANAWTGVPLLAVLGITAGNTLEALVGAYLLVRLTDFRPSLERVTDVVWLVTLGAVLSTMVSATIGTGSLLAAGEIEGGDFGSVWRTWWLGDMGGDLLIAPALMVAFTHWPYARLPGGLVEAVALAAGIAATVAFGFTREEPLTFLLLPLPILAAFRFRQPGAVGASLITAAIAIPLTEDMQGPFAGFAPDDRLLLAQLFVGIVCLTTLALAAVISERQRAEDSIRYVADTLQESLLPASLPVIAGVQAAVEFRPVGERGIVGGDFYELMEGEDGSVGIAIGDALGKGAIAAADTALARYTLRAAAMHETEPSRILSVLNEAMLRQTERPSLHGGLRAARAERRRRHAHRLDRRPPEAPDPPGERHRGTDRLSGATAGSPARPEPHGPHRAARARRRPDPLHGRPHRCVRAAPRRLAGRPRDRAPAARRRHRDRDHRGREPRGCATRGAQEPARRHPAPGPPPGRAGPAGPGDLRGYGVRRGMYVPSSSVSSISIVAVSAAAA